MKILKILGVVGLVWSTLVPCAFAEGFPGPVKLAFAAPSFELEVFERYLDALEATSEQDLVALAKIGREVALAAIDEDSESYLAATAIYSYRLETLPKESVVLLQGIAAEVSPLRNSAQQPWADAPGDKASVTYGCASQLPCDYGAPIACSCNNGHSLLTEYSVCTYKPNYNTYGGRVECDCSGSLYDAEYNCPPPSGGGCSAGCYSECGPIGGVCIHGTCTCN